MRISIVCRERPGSINAIRDASLRLVQALLDEGLEAEYLGQTPQRSWVDTEGEPVSPAPANAIVVQYQPFLWGRRGIAPRLLLDLRQIRRGARIALLVHEPFVEAESWRWALLGAWQRAQLEALRAMADIVFVTIEPWTARLAAWKPARPTVHLPVGSNLPDRRNARIDARRALGASEETLVVATFGTPHPGRLPDHATRAVRQISAGHETTWLMLGDGVPEPGTTGSARIYRPGVLPLEEVARLLSGADLFLAPFVDGVSTRRTSVMAALQHSIAVVGTRGPLTDPSLRDADGMILVPANDPEQFAAEAARLADKPAERRRLGDVGRTLYQERFAWPVIARRLVEYLEA